MSPETSSSDPTSEQKALIFLCLLFLIASVVFVVLGLDLMFSIDDNERFFNYWSELRQRTETDRRYYRPDLYRPDGFMITVIITNRGIGFIGVGMVSAVIGCTLAVLASMVKETEKDTTSPPPQ